MTRSVLLVDESADQRHMHVEFLRVAGYATLQAENAFDGYRLAVELMPEAVVTDVVLPGLNGFEFTRQLRRNQRTKDVVVLILTGLVFESDRDEAEQAGCDVFLATPCAPTVLAHEIARLLGVSRDLRARARRYRARATRACVKSEMLFDKSHAIQRRMQR